MLIIITMNTKLFQACKINSVNARVTYTDIEGSTVTCASKNYFKAKVTIQIN